MVLKSECAVDNPGDVTWTLGKPREVLCPCPHVYCPHNMISSVAHGPDQHRYTLDECTAPDGCDGDCRAWHDWAARTVSPWMHVGEVLA